ncbi:amino acid adenylation domain-containing protein, partial [Kitasatospora sp. NPDC056651]|uniref:amino acid adenylation domain-containing protein n=1 Tax=Kitasatospora sp. NPDC056651 TaxID=3345892 RepID=UPI00368AE288
MSVPELIERQTTLTPDTIAVVADGTTLDYTGLNERANRIAHLLTNHGTGPESVVGVLLDRGTDLSAGLLATWKAGAAYLPMDPSHPDERLNTTLHHAHARIVLTHTHQRHRFDTTTGLHVICLDAQDDTLATMPTTTPNTTHDPDSPAYVIYTSGSTGRPKGVTITHRGLANHITWAVAELASHGTGGAPVFSSTAFDLVVPNLWAPLAAGQAVHFLPQDLDLGELGTRLTTDGPYSFIKLTPGHLEILSHQLTDTQAADLAGIWVVAGEALPTALATRWTRLVGTGRVVNEYGPTETSVGTTTHPLTTTQPDGDTVPIGRPLPNTTTHVLDHAMQPVPIGATGELYVGGTGLARGYTHRPDLTAQRFLPNPHGTPGTRLYRTGDLVRQLPDGTIAFLGRIDHQVKIRGYRIEPEEIQARLTEHPAIRDAVVIVREDTPDDKRLAAYYTTTPGHTTPERADLTHHLTRHLPDYMIPTTYTPLDTIPLNANGKTNHKALPTP